MPQILVEYASLLYILLIEQFIKVYVQIFYVLDGSSFKITTNSVMILYLRLAKKKQGIMWRLVSFSGPYMGHLACSLCFSYGIHLNRLTFVEGKHRTIS
jgi:hypothetical protein